MPTVEKRTISLSADQARFLDELVAVGGYASASEVVRAGLRALRERDAAVERWLEAEVAPIYDALQVDPGRPLSADQVAAALPPHSCRRHRKRRRHGRNGTRRAASRCRSRARPQDRQRLQGRPAIRPLE